MAATRQSEKRVAWISTARAEQKSGLTRQTLLRNSHEKAKVFNPMNGKWGWAIPVSEFERIVGERKCDVEVEF